MLLLLFVNTCPEDTAAHPSHCGIGRRAPLRNASWDTGESPALFACTPEGLCWFCGHALPKKKHGSLIYRLWEETFVSHPELYASARDSISFISNTRRGSRWRVGRMVSSECCKLFVVILCCSSLTNGKKTFHAYADVLFTRSRVLRMNGQSDTCQWTAECMLFVRTFDVIYCQ